MPANRRLIIALFAIALGARMLFGIYADSALGVGPNLETREMLYAQEIASGLGWIAQPVSAQSPGYPMLLALLHLLAFKQIWLTFFLHAVLSAVTVVVLYYMATPLLGRMWATVASLWYALHVQHLLYSSLFVRDVLAVELLLLLVFLLARPFTRMRFAAIAGLAYAWLIHVDPQYLLLAPVLAGIAFFKSKHRIFNIQYVFLFAGVALIATLPWTIRNSLVYRQTIPVGLEATRYFKPFKVFVYQTDRTVSAVQQRVDSASRTRRTERNMTEFWRVTRFNESAPLGSNEDGSPRRTEPAWSTRHNVTSLITYGLLLPFLVVGIIAGVRRRERMILITSLVMLFYFLMRMWLGGSERARMPIDPLIILVAFYGLHVLIAYRSTRRSRPVISSGTEIPR